MSMLPIIFPFKFRVFFAIVFKLHNVIGGNITHVRPVEAMLGIFPQKVSPKTSFQKDDLFPLAIIIIII